MSILKHKDITLDDVISDLEQRLTENLRNIDRVKKLYHDDATFDNLMNKIIEKDRELFQKFISAAIMANAMSAYHIQVKSPNREIVMPPSQAPRKPPIWCESSVSPNKVARYRVPKSFPTIAAVGGTVASQVKPKPAANR